MVMKTDPGKGMGAGATGFPSPADDHLETALSLDRLLIRHPAATFFVRMQGAGMREALIGDGDLLVVDRSLTPRSGDIVMVLMEGEFSIKRLVIGPAHTRLVPENPEYPSIIVRAGQDVAIWGVITASIRRFHNGSP